MTDANKGYPESESDPFASDFRKTESECRRLFGFAQIEATPAHFGRALAMKNFWTYAESTKGYKNGR